ncbi:hypothetical protein BC941DRAFT_424110 [Chlamydoabsidia padenii]|nr:hypothetical protein BC941DRAFT_424110 [Chlamydoabsidia padenii]
MSTVLKTLASRQQGGSLILRPSRPLGTLLSSKRHGHGGVIDPHRLKQHGAKVPGYHKLLQAIRKGDQQAVWTNYMTIHQANNVGRLPSEYHSITLRSLGLQRLVTYGPDEIVAIKERLLMIWANMKHYNHTPDIRDYNHMLGFAGRASDWTLTERIWSELTEKSSRTSLWDLAPDVYSYNGYMMAAIQSKQPEKVPGIFNNMLTRLQPNTFSYNTLMDAYGHLGDVAEVDRIFNRVFITPPTTTTPTKRLGTLLHPQREPTLGRKVATLSRHAPIRQPIMTPTVDTMMALIDAHGRHGNTMGLEMIHTKLMPELGIKPTLTTYNALIRWYCKKSDIKKAKELLKEMETRGIKPNIVSFNHVFRHEALKRNRPGVAERLLDLVQQMYELRPLQSMYRHLIRIHNKHNRDQEVERLVRSYESSLKPYESSSSK